MHESFVRNVSFFFKVHFSYALLLSSSAPSSLLNEPKRVGKRQRRRRMKERTTTRKKERRRRRRSRERTHKYLICSYVSSISQSPFFIIIIIFSFLAPCRLFLYSIFACCFLFRLLFLRSGNGIAYVLCNNSLILNAFMKYASI